MFEAGRVLIGSQNYNLAGPDSDKDYKVFMCPRFCDLYYCHKADKSDIPSVSHRGDDLSPMDVRRLGELVVNGNINVTEYLFSTERHYATDAFSEYWSMAKDYYEKGYLAFVWDKWIASLEGLVKNSLDRYGVTRKTVSRAYYFYMLAATFILEDFHMSEKAWRENGWNETAREMRFNTQSWMPEKDDLFFSLEFVKNEGKKRVEQIFANKPELYKKMREWSHNLTEKMYNFVLGELKEECGKLLKIY